MTEKLNKGLPRNDSSLVVTASLQISSPNHPAMLPPSFKFVNYNNICLQDQKEKNRIDGVSCIHVNGYSCDLILVYDHDSDESYGVVLPLI